MLCSVMDDYEKLLDAAYKNLPEKVSHKERFEAPVFEAFTEGNKTVIKNFNTVVDKLRREKAFVVKWLSKEMAVPVVEENERVILQRRIHVDVLNKKLSEFIQKFVVCKECKRPDTKIMEMGHGIKKLVCEACGARAAIS